MPSDKIENCDLRIIPLGGLGEIGLNMTLYEHGDDIIIVDCGLMFPEPSMLGIDLVIPDISYLRENADRVRGIFLTHGHEDHIGALPFVLPEIPVPIYGTALTLGFVRGKLKEYELENLVELRVVKPRTIVDIGNFAVEFIRVAHSIVDGCALAIRSLEGTVIHTGDFKLDQTPVDGELTDLATLSRYGEEGVLALLSDSTNVEREGFTLSESLVGDAFDEIFPPLPGQDYRRGFLQQYPSGPAGGGIRGTLRSQGPSQRPLHADQCPDSSGTGLSAHSRQPPGGTERPPPSAEKPGLHDYHRFPGGTHERPHPDRHGRP